MNKTQFYSLSGALLASTALCAGPSTGEVLAGNGYASIGQGLGDGGSQIRAAGEATADTTSSDLVDEPGLLAGLCAAIADNVNGLLIGAVIGLILVAALFHTSWQLPMPADRIAPAFPYVVVAYAQMFNLGHVHRHTRPQASPSHLGA